MRTVLACTALALALASCTVYDSWLVSGQADSGAAGQAGGGGDFQAPAGQAGEGGRGEGDGGDGTSATGGSSGGSGGSSVGSAGSAGEQAGGAPGEGGSSGETTGGSAGSGGTGGSGGTASETCSGCARLSVPLAAAGDRTHYLIPLSGNVDFSAAVVTYRVFVHAGSGGHIQAYVQHGGIPDYNLVYHGQQSLSGLSGWTNLVWDVGAMSTPFDKTIVQRVGIEVLAGNTGPWANPTVVYLDSISVSGASTGPWTFDTADTVSAAPGGAPAGVLWLGFGDMPVAGSDVTWLGP